MNLAEVTEKVEAVERIREQMNRYPLELIYELFDLLKIKWQDKNYPPRQKALQELPKKTGFSPEMIQIAIHEMASLFDTNEIKKKIATELQGIPRGKEFKFCDKTQRALKWHPLGLVLHILSGNVFLVGPSSFIESVITGNATILKMSSEETFFMPLFLESVREAEKELNHPDVISQSVALIEYSSSQKEVISFLKNRVDGLLVWGGEEAIKAYRNDLPARVRFINFGPKLSFALIMKSALGQEKDFTTYARLLSHDLAIWDQQACTAPQLAFVQGEENSKKFIEALAKEMTDIEKKIPIGAIDDESAADIRKLRTIHEIKEILDQGVLRESSPYDLRWTLILDSNQSIEPSPLNRTLRIIPFNHIDEILEQVKNLRSYIQTIGIASNPSEQFLMSEKFGALGALRLMPLGEMSGGEIDDPHDGSYDLPQLMNLVVTKVARNHLIGEKTLSSYLSEEQKQEILLEKLRKTLKNSIKAPFYKKSFYDINIHQIKTLKDFEKIPILSRSQLEKNMPPHNFHLCTLSNPSGGSITRSGGSTGEPKFSWFTQNDWEEMILSASQVFKNCGFSSQDRMVNCFLAGDLYGSFISFQDANRALGMTTFPFAGKISASSLLDIWDRFQVNALQGVPTFFIPLLKEAKQINKNFTLEKIMYAGQHLQEVDRRWLKEELQVKLVASIIGTTEAGQIAYQDDSCLGKEHLLIDDYTYVEIVDEQGRAVPAGMPGKILVTALRKFDFPVIRYDIGDLGEYLACEKSNSFRPQRIRYHGRHDDIVVIGMMNVSYSDFSKALDETKINFSELQLKTYVENDLDHIEVNIESDIPDGLEERRIFQIFEERIHELKSHLQNNLIKMDIHLLPHGTIPRNSRTGKIKNIVDLRV